MPYPTLFRSNPAQLLRTAGDPPGRCFAIIGPRRPRIFGRQTIIDSDDGQIELPSRLSAKRRMGVQIAQYKSTPVEKNHCRDRRPHLPGIEHAKGEFPPGPGKRTTLPEGELSLP